MAPWVIEPFRLLGGSPAISGGMPANRSNLEANRLSGRGRLEGIKSAGGIIARREMTSLNDTGDGSAADGGGSIGRGSSTMVMMILFFVCDEFVLD